MQTNVNYICSTLTPTPSEPKIPRTQPISTCIRLKADSPLSRLNELFPTGIPVVSSQPNLWIGQWECFEVRFSAVNLADLAIALFQFRVPDELCLAWLEWSIVAVPFEWTEP